MKCLKIQQCRGKNRLPAAERALSLEARLRTALLGARGTSAPSRGAARGSPDAARSVAEEGIAAQDEAAETREVHLKVDTRFALVKVVGEAGQEARDKNMPRNLHNAAELFLRCGLVAAAERLRETTAAMFAIYAANPDGASHSMGRAAVCWDCGHCGLPRDAAAAAPACGACGSADANWLRVQRDKGGDADVPWIQKKALTPEEQRQRDAARVAAKRAEVEENVRRALDERRAAAAAAGGAPEAA